MLHDDGAGRAVGRVGAVRHEQGGGGHETGEHDRQERAEHGSAAPGQAQRRLDGPDTPSLGHRPLDLDGPHQPQVRGPGTLGQARARLGGAARVGRRHRGLQAERVFDSNV
jgi:hypothetical protein